MKMIKTIFDKSTREELTQRVHSINEKKVAGWGKMNVYQLVKHCIIWNEWVLAKNDLPNKQSILGIIFGKMALKGIVKDDKPMKKNMPAGRGFVDKEVKPDLETLKHTLTDLIADYANFSSNSFNHDFFAKMTKEEIGILAFKHADHHLRQFGA